MTNFFEQAKAAVVHYGATVGSKVLRGVGDTLCTLGVGLVSASLGRVSYESENITNLPADYNDVKSDESTSTMALAGSVALFTGLAFKAWAQSIDADNQYGTTEGVHYNKL